jgi:hypothetical protein
MDTEKMILEIFDGQMAPAEFLADKRIFMNFAKDLQKEIVLNTIIWYPKADVDKEWEEWLKDKKDEQKKELKTGVKFILFILKTGLQKGFSEEEFREELKLIGLQSDIIDFFSSEIIKNKRELARKIMEDEKPIISTLHSLKWRIDVKKTSAHLQTINEPCIIVKISLSEPKDEDIVFEMTGQELKSLVKNLSRAQKEIEKTDQERQK